MRLFISYAHDDEYLVRTQIVEILIGAGYDPWFDHHLIIGIDWKQQLFNAIRDCDAFVYALTPEALRSEWCQWEFAQAVTLGKPIIPILLQKTELPANLSNIQYVDFTLGATGQATAKLMGGLTSIQVHIPREQMPAAPVRPQGKPSWILQQQAKHKQTNGIRRLITAIIVIMLVILSSAGIVTGVIPGFFGFDKQSDQPNATPSHGTALIETTTVITLSSKLTVPTGTGTADSLATEMISQTLPAASRQPTSIPITVTPRTVTSDQPLMVICQATAINESGVKNAILPIVREEPSRNAAVVGSVTSDRKYPVISRSAVGRDVWYQLADDNARILGWVSALDVTVDGDCMFG